MQNADSELEGCMKEKKDNYEQNKNLMNRDTFDKENLSCMSEYKEQLKIAVPIVNKMYDGYILNYSKVDGTMVEFVSKNDPEL